MNQRGKRIVVSAAVGAGLFVIGRSIVRRSRQIDFRGAAVLITGGSRGLGLLLARQLADHGARVAILARDREELEQARHDIAQHSGDPRDVFVVQCDVTNRDAATRAVNAVRDRWGRIDVLINNAGVIQVGPLEEMTLEDFEQAMRVHYWGPLHTTLAVLPEMRKRRSGRIVNITSIGGQISVPHMLPYSASKFALVGLSEGFRAELLKDGIYVTTVCPGLMRTGSHVRAQFKGKHEQEYAWFSVSASAPLVAMNAEHAADQIIRACREGRAHVVLSFPAKLASLLHGIAPGVTADMLSVANRMLPSKGGIDTQSVEGLETHPRWPLRWLTRLGTQAARRNNEIAPGAEQRLQGAVENTER